MALTKRMFGFLVRKKDCSGNKRTKRIFFVNYYKFQFEMFLSHLQKITSENYALMAFKGNVKRV